jgi:hypothetical protein
VHISSTCNVRQKLGVSIPLLTWSPSAWPSRLLYRRGRKSRRDLWITLYYSKQLCSLEKLKRNTKVTEKFLAWLLDRGRNFHNHWFNVFTAVTTNISEWRDVTPCRFVEIYRLSVFPDKGGSKFVRNTITFIPKWKCAGSIPGQIRLGFVFEMVTLEILSLIVSMLPLHHFRRCPILIFVSYYRGADKSLARPGRKQATATEDIEFYISYL